MKRKIFNEKNYNLHILNTKKFKTIDIILSYKGKRSLKSDVCLELLETLLFYATKDYPNKLDFDRALGEMYDLRLKVGKYKRGKYDDFMFSMTLINEKYTEKNMNKKSIEFGLKQFFNPLAKNGAFDKEIFEMAKKLLIEYLKGSKNDPDYYSRQKIGERLGKKELLIYTDKERLDYLEKINEKNLYYFYKKMLKNYKLDIFVIGDVSFEEINKIFLKNIKERNQNKENMNFEVSFDKFKKRITYKEESSLFNQSKLEIGYKFKDLTDYEKEYVSFIYNSILGGGTDSLLFNEIRGKRSLCYYVYSVSSVRSSMGIIRAGVSEKNIKKVIKISKKCMEDIRNGNFDENLIEKAKKCYINATIENEDSAFMILYDYMCSYAYGTNTMDKSKEMIKCVTKEDVIKFANKIYLDTTFVLRGDRDDKENI